MADETRMILEMLKEGKITVEQAERLLGAVGSQTSADGETAGEAPGENDQTCWSWSHSGSGDGPCGADWNASWSWVGDLGTHVQAEVHRATSEARSAVDQAMSEACRAASREARRAGREAQRAGREARRQVIRIVQEIGRDPE